MSKYGDVIRQARQMEPKGKSATANKQASKQESQQTSKPEEVNLSIKVSKERRKHWGVEAKRQDTTLTATIIEALSERFGEPEEA